MYGRGTRSSGTPPARRLQEVPGGAGIVLDDVFAALYSLLLNHVLLRLILR